MLETLGNKEDILSTLRGVTDADASSEQLFDLMFDFFVASKDEPHENLSMCEDVLTQLIAYVEVEARRRISERLSHLDYAPRRVVKTLAIESIDVAKPVLTRSPVLEDEDLLMVTRVCGSQHLEAIAQRPEISAFVTNELMRLGGIQVWERVARNSGASLEDKTVGFLVNRSKENPRIQLSLIDRQDLPESTLAKLVSEAGETVRAHLHHSGRAHLVKHLESAEAATAKRIREGSSLHGMDFETALNKVLQESQQIRLNWGHLMEAASRDNFPRTCAIFAYLSDMKIEEAIHWLSRSEIDPAIVAFKALNLHRDLVATLLRTGPWQRILSTKKRIEALKTFDRLNPILAERSFAARNDSFAQEVGCA
ncbi:MAG: DUF2336 domain-containing protein [Hyphomicrobiales bacterium]